MVSWCHGWFDSTQIYKLIKIYTFYFTRVKDLDSDLISISYLDFHSGPFRSDSHRTNQVDILARQLHLEADLMEIETLRPGFCTKIPYVSYEHSGLAWGSMLRNRLVPPNFQDYHVQFARNMFQKTVLSHAYPRVYRAFPGSQVLRMFCPSEFPGSQVLRMVYPSAVFPGSQCLRILQ